MILGKRDVAETRDLLAVADYRFVETGKAYKALETKPLDPNTRAGIKKDWETLVAKWVKARSEISHALVLRLAAFPLVPANTIPSQEQWDQIQSFIYGQENVKGSLQDITKRIEMATGAKILYPNQPAQNSQDVDLTVFKELDALIRAGEQGSKQAATSNLGLIIGGTILGTLVAIVALKRV